MFTISAASSRRCSRQNSLSFGESVVVASRTMRVLIKDYDTEGLDPEVYDVHRNENDDQHTLTDRSP